MKRTHIVYLRLLRSTLLGIFMFQLGLSQDSGGLFDLVNQHAITTAADAVR